MLLGRGIWPLALVGSSIHMLASLPDPCDPLTKHKCIIRVRQYAQWEEKQKDFRRARSVWERALDVNYNAVQIWLKYAEMEMRHRFVNHARNVWDRAVTLMPRVDQLW